MILLDKSSSIDSTLGAVSVKYKKKLGRITLITLEYTPNNDIPAWTNIITLPDDMKPDGSEYCHASLLKAPGYTCVGEIQLGGNCIETAVELSKDSRYRFTFIYFTLS